MRKKTMKAGNWMIPVSSSTPAPVSMALSSLPSTHNVLNAPSVPNVPSLPTSGFTPTMMHQEGGLDPVSVAIASINTNPYVIGIFMLLLNLGGRFLSLELSKKQEEFLQSKWVRPLIFFTVIFIATRNLVAAFWVTLLFFFIIWVVANENSKFCLIPSWCGHSVTNDLHTYHKNIEKLDNTVAENTL